MTRVKICGITSAGDAEAAVRSGADALGFVFVPGTPRHVSAEAAAEIVAALPPFVTPVGVFLDQPREEILACISRCGLQAVQLHGRESPELSRAMPLPVIKGLRIRDRESLSPLLCYPARAFLLDSHVEGAPGGTGTAFPWELAIGLASRAPIILAGGLTPGNVAEAVRRVRPYGVDVSSGVERAPGRKDHRKLEEFIANVHSADRA
ncbi:MAG: phosphoribosylanthranilate isomerase [candidate division NC10 bacterium]|nr:phosphoribosylanthranilate isomerase [candidate division NC10 bacterium]